MPFFKKRRRSPAGPNKNQKKIMRGQEASRMAHSAGVMGEKFPSVNQLSILLDFMTPQQYLIDQQTRVLTPADPCDLLVPCPGRCAGEGSFDLLGKIKSVVDSRSTHSESSGVCRQPLYPGSPDLCGSHLRCKIEVSYLPEEE